MHYQARPERVPGRRVRRRIAAAICAPARGSSLTKSFGGSPHQPDFGARHRRYRCSLPGLTGFTTSRREGADTDCHGLKVADRQGFEPWNTVRCYLLSKQAPSTARPPVRGADDTNSSLFRLRSVRTFRVGERGRDVETGLILAPDALRRVERRNFERIARIRRIEVRGRLEGRKLLGADVILVVLLAGRRFALAAGERGEREDAGEENDG